MNIPLISNIIKKRRIRQEHELQMMIGLGYCLRCKGRGNILVSPCYSMICGSCKGTGRKK